MGTFDKVQPGDGLNIPAQLYNYVIDVVTDYLKRTQNGGGPDRGAETATSIVPILNGTGTDLPRFSVVGLESTIDDPTDSTVLNRFKDSPRFIGRVPTTDDSGKFGVLIYGTSNDRVGDAVVSGVVIVQIDEGDGTDSADVADGVTDSLIATATGAAKVLYRAPGSGKQWGVVRLGGGAALPAGQYDGMIPQTTSQLTLGMGFLRLVNTPPV